MRGCSDEEKLGVSYQAIHRYIREGGSGDAAADEKIRSMERANLHKRKMPLVLNPFEEDSEQHA